MRRAAFVVGLGALAAGCGASSTAKLDSGADTTTPSDAAAPIDTADLGSGDGTVDAGDDADDAAPALPRALFNGVDFTGWDLYLGEPTPGANALGIDNDPLGVYSIVTVDGEPAIRISGEVWGALISQQELCDFHLSLDYRWGTAVWPPLDSFDSGVMYLSTGPLGAVNAGGTALSNPIGSGGFMVSVEYQITPGDVGGMYNLGPITFQAGARAQIPETPGAWNHVDISVQGGVARHQLNGQDVTTGSGFAVAWPGQPAQALTCGKLQLQSEGAEIFFRRVQLLPPT